MMEGKCLRLLLTIIIAEHCWCKSEWLMEINHITFSSNHIFYLSNTGNHFGFISRQTGEIMTKYQLQPHQTIISVHKATDSVVLRSDRNRAVLFDIASSHIEEINVQITFQHQQIMDVLVMKGKYYVLTDKDVRMYDGKGEKMDESLKNIVSSARKNEFFKKMLLRVGETLEEMLIVLIKNGEICIRSFRRVKKGTDQCYFKVPYQITAIDRISNSILIQTEAVNYVISPEASSPATYSFKGKVTQFSDEFIQLTQFQTYDIQNQVFLQGLIVEGSRKGLVFWIQAVTPTRIAIFYNSLLVGEEEVSSLPRRSWVSSGQGKDEFDLLLEFEENLFQMYHMKISQQNSSFILAWRNKQLRPNRSEEL